jgi:hypothetical protein
MKKLLNKLTFNILRFIAKRFRKYLFLGNSFRKEMEDPLFAESIYSGLSAKEMARIQKKVGSPKTWDEVKKI